MNFRSILITLCILLIVIIAGYFYPKKYYFECTGTIFSPIEKIKHEQNRSLSKEEESLLEIYRAVEMLIFGTQDQVERIQDKKILVLNNYYFGFKQTLNQDGWENCSNDDVSVTCKKDFESITFNMIEQKLTSDIFNDFEKIESKQFAIYDCKKVTHLLGK